MIIMKYCVNCGENIQETTEYCPYCGVKNSTSPNYGTFENNSEISQTNIENNSDQAVQVQKSSQIPKQEITQEGYDYPTLKYRIVAGILALLFGTFGIHKFYMNKSRTGLLYLLFFWTGILTLIGIAESILYFTDKVEIFNQRLNLHSYPPKYPKRDRWFAIVLAFVYGWFGGHMFFLKDPRAIYYAIFFFTGIPWIISICQGLIFLFEPKENFVYRYGF